MVGHTKLSLFRQHFYSFAVIITSAPVDNLLPCRSLQDGIFYGRQEGIQASPLKSGKKTPATENHPWEIRAEDNPEGVA